MLLRRTTRTVAAVMLVVGGIAGCSSDAAPTVDPADYRADLAALCTASAAERAALALPDDTAVTAFARSVADILNRQADDARALRPPPDLDDDHRAFVQNTADQAVQWTALAATSPDDADRFGEIQTAILELTLGRDDLATAMAVPECRVQST